MTYYRVPPPKPLQGLIDSFSYWEGGEPSADLMVVMATRTLSIQIDLQDNELCWYSDNTGSMRHKLKGVTIAGAQARSFAVDAWQPKFVRVVFKPGGAYPFLRPSPSELRDTLISLEDIWGSAAARLQQQLAEAPTPDVVFHLLGEYLIAAACGRFQNHPAIVATLASCEQSSDEVAVSDLAQQVNLSPKRFIRLFTEEVGLTPKLYLRIGRFERLQAELFSANHIDWARIALDYGYFDQSHLIRDFREFAGMTPATYLGRRGPAEHHAV